VQDISETGLRFEPAAPVRPGATYAFHVDLGSYSLSVPIRITRCHAAAAPKGAAPGRSQAGAEFLWDDPESRARFAGWLQERGPDSGSIRADLKG